MAIFNGTEGSAIELSQALTWTANYRTKTERDDSGIIVKAHFFGREILEKLLSQDGCVGIRMYYALDAKGQKQLVLVGADENGNDLVELVADNSRVCPPDCSQNGGLNG